MLRLFLQGILQRLQCGLLHDGGGLLRVYRRRLLSFHRLGAGERSRGSFPRHRRRRSIGHHGFDDGWPFYHAVNRSGRRLPFLPGRMKRRRWRMRRSERQMRAIGDVGYNGGDGRHGGHGSQRIARGGTSEVGAGSFGGWF